MSIQALTLGRDASLEFEASSGDPAIGTSEVAVEFLAMPINPVDLLVTTGRYPTKPLYQAGERGILGFEGVGRVIRCGSAVNNVKAGDLVLPRVLGIGTWRNLATLAAEHIQKIDPPNDVVFAAILRASVMPAYLLLEDMATLRPGDWIIQNAATSTIAQMITQFARLRGLHTISVIRPREGVDLDVTVEHLEELGADVVLMEGDLEGNREFLRGKRVTLALDAVFGTSGAALANCLSEGGTFVNYGMLGGLNSQLTLSTTHLFWKQLIFKSFRGSKQLALRSETELSDCHNWCINLFNSGTLKLPSVETIHWDTQDAVVGSKLIAAVERAGSKTLGRKKQVFLMQHGH